MQTDLQPGQRVTVEAVYTGEHVEGRGILTFEKAHSCYPVGDGLAMSLPLSQIHPLPADGGWMPIESAPKNGTQIILGYNYEGYLFTCSDGRWTDHNGGGWVRSCMFQPTCWMPLTIPPLPSPPQAEGGAAK